MISKRAKINTTILGCDISNRRKCLGISQKAFADLIGVKPQALCRIEKGNHLPKHATLEAIEVTLDLVPGFYTNRRKQIAEDICFDRTSDLKNPENRFRPIYKDHTFDTEKLQQLTHDIDRKVSAYVKCESELGLPRYDPFHLNDLEMESGRDGLIAADEFRSQLGIGLAPLHSSLPLLEQRCVRLIPIDGLAPAVLPSNGRDKWRHSFPFHDLLDDNLVIAINTTSPAHSQLYDIGYSIAAYFRYRHFELSSRTPSNTDESEFCRAFASELLSPHAALCEAMGTLRLGEHELSVGILDVLAARFGISTFALIWTLKGLGLVSLKTFKRLKAEAEMANLPDRPPLVFGTWLKALELRVASFPSFSSSRFAPSLPHTASPRNS